MQNRSQIRPFSITMDKAINPQEKYTTANFNTLYQQYATRIYRYIFARVNNHADAEDLTTQVFMAVLKGINKFDPEGNFAAWIFTIARNKVADRYRKNKPILSIDTLPDLVAENEDPFNQVIQNEKRHQLFALLNDLKTEQQELLQLRFAGELSYAQIARVVGKTEASVKMATNRLLHQLKNKMEQKNE